MHQLNEQEWLKALEKTASPQSKSYSLMYSSLWGGYVKKPALMQIPVDDHQVHRGDAVFEAIKFIDKKIYLWQPHLERLMLSAEKIHLKSPYSISELQKRLQELVNASDLSQGLIRLFLSRGPGGFTTNPYDSVGAQLYIIITELKPPALKVYEEGIRLGRSEVEQKSGFWAQIKSCNYLPNVLMKKESIDKGFDLTVGFDANNFMTESSTENIVYLDKDKNLYRPLLRNILKGTTMMRAFHLAEQLKKENLIKAISEKDISENDLIQAEEAMVIGTTWDVAPIVSYNGKNIGNGRPGSCAKRLNELIRADQK